MLGSSDELIEAKVGGVSVTFLIDSGSPVCTIPQDEFEKLKMNKAQIFDVRGRVERKFFAYGCDDKPLTVLGAFKARIGVGYGKPETTADFFVIKDARRALIGKATALELQILKLGVHISAVSATVYKEFPKVPGRQFSFTIDRSVPPHKSAYFRVPVAVEEAVDKKTR